MRHNYNRVKRVVIVGFGSIGQRHFQILKKLRPSIKIILIRSGIGKKNKIENLANGVFKNINDINLKIDAAIICSPAPFHLEQAKIFVKKKIPVLIEKPLSNNLNNIKNFELLCKKLNALILVGYNLRYSKSLNFFYKLVLSLKVGKPLSATIRCTSYLPNWRPKQNYIETISASAKLGGGVLFELSHELDYANWIFGYFNQIHSSINYKKLKTNVEDCAYLNLISKKNLSVSIFLDFLNKKIERTCKLYGSQGILTWNGIEDYVMIEKKNGKVKKWKFNDDRNSTYEYQLSHFINCIEKKTTPKVSLQNGIDALKLVLMAKKSNRNNKIIKLKFSI